MAANVRTRADEEQVAVPKHAGDRVLEFAHKFAEAIEEEQKRMDEWEQKAQKREEAWTRASQRFDVSQLGEPVVFNIGGVKFATSIDTLRKVPDTYFSNLVSGRWDVKWSKDGSIFIDRDPAAFGFMLRYLRDPEDFHNIQTHMTELERYYFEKDCEFYMMPQQVLDSFLGISPGFGMSSKTFKNLQDLIGFKSHRLLYRCTTDGYGPAMFHEKCDNQGPIVLIAEIAGGGFVGAYASVWSSGTSNYVADASAFLFTIKNGDSVVNQFKQTGNFTKALYHNPSHGATFGGGHDFKISMNRPLTFNCGATHTYAPHGIANGTALNDVCVFAVQK